MNKLNTVPEMKQYIKEHGLKKKGMRLTMKKPEMIEAFKQLGHWIDSEVVVEMTVDPEPSMIPKTSKVKFQEEPIVRTSSSIVLPSMLSTSPKAPAKPTFSPAPKDLAKRSHLYSSPIPPAPVSNVSDMLNSGPLSAKTMEKLNKPTDFSAFFRDPNEVAFTRSLNYGGTLNISSLSSQDFKNVKESVKLARQKSDPLEVNDSIDTDRYTKLVYQGISYNLSKESDEVLNNDLEVIGNWDGEDIEFINKLEAKKHGKKTGRAYKILSGFDIVVLK